MEFRVDQVHNIILTRKLKWLKPVFEHQGKMWSTLGLNDSNNYPCISDIFWVGKESDIAWRHAALRNFLYIGIYASLFKLKKEGHATFKFM